MRRLFYKGEGENQRILFYGELNKKGVSVAFKFKPNGRMSRSGRSFGLDGTVWIHAGRRRAHLIYEFQTTDPDISEGAGKLQIYPV